MNKNMIRLSPCLLNDEKDSFNVKKQYFLSAFVLAMMMCAMTIGATAVQAEDTQPAYTMMTQAPWETQAMEGEEAVSSEADASHTATKPFRQMVEEAKTTYMEETPDLYTKGKDSPWAMQHQSGNVGQAPAPGYSKTMTHHTTTASSIVMPHHTGKLKPMAGYVPTKRPVTPDHTPWKEMRAFTRGGDLMFY
jgi:hypothetical protein